MPCVKQKHIKTKKRVKTKTAEIKDLLIGIMPKEKGDKGTSTAFKDSLTSSTLMNVIFIIFYQHQHLAAISKQSAKLFPETLLRFFSGWTPARFSGAEREFSCFFFSISHSTVVHKMEATALAWWKSFIAIISVFTWRQTVCCYLYQSALTLHCEALIGPHGADSWLKHRPTSRLQRFGKICNHLSFIKLSSTY